MGNSLKEIIQANKNSRLAFERLLDSRRRKPVFFSMRVVFCFRSMANLAVAGLVLVSLGCVSGGSTARHDPIVVEINHVLADQADAWNAGDVEKFMSSYWHSKDLTFSSGGTVTRGWESALQRYKRKYPTREAMGQLAFDGIEVAVLGRDSALVLGDWHLDREGPVGGAFSLVMRRIGGEWVIVHDHTSRREN